MQPAKTGKALASLAAVLILAMLLLTSTSLAFKTGVGIDLSGSSTDAGSASGYWYVGAYSYDNVTFSNNGVRSVMQVRGQNVSAFLSFWVSDTLSNNLWGQVGYYFFHGSGPTAFYQVWNLTTRTEMGYGTTAVSPGTHLFSMALLHGDTWEFSVDSQKIGTFNMQTGLSSSNDSVAALSEEGYCNSPFPFQPVTFEQAIQVLKGGSWITPAFADTYGNFWGVQGSAQNASLSNSEIIIGGNYLTNQSGSTLWS